MSKPQTRDSYLDILATGNMLLTIILNHLFIKVQLIQLAEEKTLE